MAPTIKRQNLSFWHFISSISVLFSLLLSSFAHAQDDLQMLDRIVAVVNDDVIMESELNNKVDSITYELQSQQAQLPPQDIFREQVLERMIVERLQLELAKRNSIKIDDNSLNQGLASIAQENNMSLEDFAREVQREVGWSTFREDVRNEMMMSQLHQQAVSGRVQVTDKEVERFLDSEMSKRLFNAELKLGHILIETPDDATPDEVDKAKQEAEQIVADVRSGKSFRDLAARHSAGNEALEGGELGWRPAAEWPSLFSEAAIGLKKGDVSDPLRAGNGFHIIQLQDKRGGDTQVVEQYKVRHILITSSAVRSANEAKDLIDQLHDDVINGGDFAELAKEHSKDPGSARDGGSLGWVNPGEMVPEFEEMYKNTPIGKVSPVFQSEYGWHFLQVEDKRTADMSDEYREIRAKQALQQRRYEEELEKWLRELRNEAYVDIRL